MFWGENWTQPWHHGQSFSLFIKPVKHIRRKFSKKIFICRKSMKHTKMLRIAKKIWKFPFPISYRIITISLVPFATKLFTQTDSKQSPLDSHQYQANNFLFDLPKFLSTSRSFKERNLFFIHLFHQILFLNSIKVLWLFITAWQFTP